MRLEYPFLTIATALVTTTAFAQSTPTPPAGEGPRHDPPPQAYTDCQGKKEGATVQHTTPEGVVPAVCVNSPKGLVARPSRPRPQDGASPASAPPSAPANATDKPRR
ncbi:hypothetical protein [Niveibacterium umoris]|uniref:Uncharacterized protein n=1 Tax=Niveibacterium umoris TaxID=1193620 RepID=A0A840BBR2_9RHOO|nr:hypothetical protein [Niveibacterium umoris]MBB4010981.1 hypothetical protein [Niveibacterium umoris]